MFSKFSTVLTNAIEAAFAPETSLYEDFQFHWQAIMNYYSEFTDETIHIDATNIPNHLKQMLHILIDEEEAIESIEAGPCMEFLLQQRILETLGTLGTGDIPMGMKSRSLWFFTTVLSKIRQPLLAHTAVFNPVLEMIKICGKVQASPTELEEINFLAIICTKLQQETHLVKFFIVDEELENMKKDQKLKMEKRAMMEVLKQQKMDANRVKQEELLADLQRDSLGNSRASTGSEADTSGAGSQNKVETDNQNNDDKNEETENNPPSQAISNTSISKTTASEASALKPDKVDHDENDPQNLQDNLQPANPNSNSSKYRSASGHTVNFTDSSSDSPYNNSSRNTSKDGRDSPEQLNQQPGKLSKANSVITDSSRSAVDMSSNHTPSNLSRASSIQKSFSAHSNSNNSVHSSLHSKSSLSKSSVSHRLDSYSRPSSAQSSSHRHTRTSSISKRTRSLSSRVSNSRGLYRSKSLDSTASSRHNSSITNSTNSHTHSHTHSSSSSHRYRFSSIDDTSELTTKTNLSLLTSSENCSDTDDDFTESEDERKFAVLKVNLFAHNRKDQENATREVKVYMTTYQRKKPNFDLAESLINLLRSPDARIAMKAMESILKIVALPEKNCASSLIKSTRIREYFSMKLVTEIISLPGPHCYPKVAPINPEEIQETEAYPWGETIDPVLENYDWFPGKKELKSFLTTWDFVNRLIIESHHYFAVPMSRYIRRKVLQPIIKQILSRSIEEEALLSFSSLLIKLLDSTKSMALRHQLMMFLMGKHESTFNHEIKSRDIRKERIKIDKHFLKTSSGFLNAADLKNARKKITAIASTNIYETVIDRCNHVSDDLGKVIQILDSETHPPPPIINLKIFECCLKNPEQVFMDEMILKYIDKRQYLEDKSFLPQFNIQEAVNAYKSMLPHNLRTSEYHDRATESYIYDYFTELQEISRVCGRLRWPKVLMVKNKKVSQTKQTKPASRRRASSLDDSDLLSEKSNISDYEPFEEGSFLNMLLDKLQDFCNQSYSVNLEVTNLIAKLLILPHPAVTEFFLNPEIYNKNKLCRLKQDVRTPYSILKKVVIGIVTRTVKIPDINRLLHRRKKRMENPDLPRWHDVPLDEETENLLSSIILLEEFCKELAAITVVKFETAEKALKQQQSKLAAQNPANQNFSRGRGGTRTNQPGNIPTKLNAAPTNGNLGFGGGTILVAEKENENENDDDDQDQEDQISDDSDQNTSSRSENSDINTSEDEEIDEYSQSDHY